MKAIKAIKKLEELKAHQTGEELESLNLAIDIMLKHLADREFNKFIFEEKMKTLVNLQNGGRPYAFKCLKKTEPILDEDYQELEKKWGILSN